MVQYSFPRSLREELSHQSRNLEETAYCSEALLSEEDEEGCVDPAPEED
jgi:hypothetical protein